MESMESMGSYVEMHADKRRGTMDISDIGKEALIHWNGPPLARANSLGEAALDRHFGGRDRFLFIIFAPLFFILYRWHFVTMGNNSKVIKRLKEEEPAFPFFS